MIAEDDRPAAFYYYQPAEDEGLRRDFAHLIAEDVPSRLGFSYARSSIERCYFLSVPYWSLVAVCSLVPTIRCVAWIRRRRRGAAGRCPKCGYDLRATPRPPVPPFKPGELLAVCPECGHARHYAAVQ
jgi:hypothetical protein